MQSSAIAFSAREAVDQIGARLRRDARPSWAYRTGSGSADRRTSRCAASRRSAPAIAASCGSSSVAEDELAVDLRDVEQDGALVDEPVERDLRDLDAVRVEVVRPVDVRAEVAEQVQHPEVRDVAALDRADLLVAVGRVARPAGVLEADLVATAGRTRTSGLPLLAPVEEQDDEDRARRRRCLRPQSGMFSASSRLTSATSVIEPATVPR